MPNSNAYGLTRADARDTLSRQCAMPPRLLAATRRMLDSAMTLNEQAAGWDAMMVPGTMLAPPAATLIVALRLSMAAAETEATTPRTKHQAKHQAEHQARHETGHR